MRYFDFDPLRGEELELNADLLALLTAIVPEDPTTLAKMLKRTFRTVEIAVLLFLPNLSEN